MFKVIRIEIYKNRRFHLNSQLSHFIFEPRQSHQVIIGTNGSGKTSLMALLTGWPCDHNDLLAGGRVVLDVSNHGKNYRTIVEKDLEGKVTYGFFEDNRDLNPTQRITIQRQLVHRYLGVDKDTMLLMSGVEVMTKMSPTRRKDWFIKTSQSDFDYIIDVYNRIRKKITTQKALLAHANKKLLRTISLETVDLDTAQTELNELKDRIELLLSNKGPWDPNKYTIEAYQRDYQATKKTYQSFKKQYREYLTVLQTSDIAAEHINQLSHYRASKESTYNHLQHQINETLKELTVIQESQSHHAMLPSVVEINQELSALPELLTDTRIGTELELSDLKYLKSKLSGYLDAIGTPTCTLKELNGYLERLTIARGLLNRDLLDHAIAERKALLTMQSHQLSCPSCNHVYYHADEEDKAMLRGRTVEAALVDADRAISNYSAIVDSAINEVALLEELIADNPAIYETLAEACKLIHRYDSHIDLAGLWADTLRPKKYMNDLTLMIRSIENHLYNLTIKKKRKELTDLLSTHESIQSSVDSSSLALAEQLNSKLDQLYSDSASITLELNLIKRVEDQQNKLMDLKKSVSDQMGALKEYVQLAVTAEENDRISQEILTLKEKSVQVELAYRESSNKAQTIASLEEEVAELNLTISRLNALESTMSAKGGMIGHSIFGYLNCFIDLMNYYLKALANYDIYLTVPEVTELDYTFPIKIASSASKDVSLTSTGQQELINLAYKLSMLELLRLDSSALFLDEFGASLDTATQAKAYGFIIETLKRNPKQLFMVSHSPNLYANLNTEAEFTILDKSGINLSGCPNRLNTALTVFN